MASVEAWLEAFYAPEDPELRGVRNDAERRGFPEIHLPRLTARTIQLLLPLIGARRVIEVGTLAGYSAHWIGRALPPGGLLVTLEIDGERAEAARGHLARAGLGDRVEVREGDARLLLEAMEDPGGWDAMHLDADKEGLPHYIDEAHRLLRPDGLLLIDNVLWKGKIVDFWAQGSDAMPSEPPVAEGDEVDEATAAILRVHRTLVEDRRWDPLVLPIGDGLALARRRPG
jgi:caffeoyl-CoA O-methyltransferase